VSVASSSPLPAGWYPDPAGAPQWRVWNGREWSNVTKPYNVTAPAEPIPLVLDVLTAVRYLRSVGIPVLFAGFALLISLLAHLPGTAQPLTNTWASAAFTVAIGAIAFGSILCGYLVRAIQGHWSVDAFIPIVNLLSVNVLVARALRLSSFGSPPLFEALLLGLAGLAFRDPLVTFLLLGSLSRTYLVRLSTLRSALVAPR
jgi:hypothetical protein